MRSEDVKNVGGAYTEEDEEGDAMMVLLMTMQILAILASKDNHEHDLNCCSL